MSDGHHARGEGRLTRRRFLWGLGAGSLAAGSLLLGKRAGQEKGELRRVERAAHALGAAVSITALHACREQAQRAVAECFEELGRVDELMSLYRPGSQLCALNRDGALDSPHAWMLEVLRKAEEVSRRTGGAFDITVQPLWEVHAQAARAGKTPTPQAIEAARARVDWRRVCIERGRVALNGSGMALTLNGIAQGYAADRVLGVLRRHGIEHALVDTGEVGAVGRRADRAAWTAGVQHPRHPEAYVAVAQLDGRCLSTSGDYATKFRDDYASHHIVDPATGRSPSALASVTVMAGTGIEADALSTAVFVLGAQRGMELVRSTSGADALLVTKEGRILCSAGFPLVS